MQKFQEENYIKYLLDDNTEITIQGFKKDQLRINEYFRKQIMSKYKHFKFKFFSFEL